VEVKRTFAEILLADENGKEYEYSYTIGYIIKFNE